MDYKDWIILCLLGALLWCASTDKAHGSEVHLAVGIEYTEPTENDCSATTGECSSQLTDLQKVVVELDGITDDFPKSVYSIPATRPTGGNFVRKWFCLKTNTESLSRFEAKAYAVDLNGNTSAKVFAMKKYTGSRKRCGPSAIEPEPENFRVVE